MSSAYGGVENLEVMAEAVRYNGYLDAQLRAVLPDPSEAVMDFGAGSGTFAVPLRDCGVSVTCVEPDGELGRRLRERGLCVVRSLDEVPTAAFKLIYSLNVLEHIEDDRGAVTRLRDHLAPGGSLFLYVPAFQVLYSSMDRRVGHLRRYRRAGMLALLAEAGLVPLTVRYVDSLGFLAALAYRLMGSSDGSINRRALVFYDRWLFPFSLLLDRVTGRWFGKNLLVIAKVDR
jgi:SAM-dependent methyltransferase